MLSQFLNRLVFDRDTEACDMCGAPTYEFRARIICVRCGYERGSWEP